MANTVLFKAKLDIAQFQAALRTISTQTNAAQAQFDGVKRALVASAQSPNFTQAFKLDTAELSSFNATINQTEGLLKKVFTITGRSPKSGNNIFSQTFETFHSLDAVLPTLEAYRVAVEKAATATERSFSSLKRSYTGLGSTIERYNQRLAHAQGAIGPAQQAVNEAQARRDALRAERSLYTPLPSGQFRGPGARFYSATQVASVDAEIANAERELASRNRALGNARRQETVLSQNLAKAEAERITVTKRLTAGLDRVTKDKVLTDPGGLFSEKSKGTISSNFITRGMLSRTRRAEIALTRALSTEISTPPPNIARIAQESPQLLRLLQRGGTLSTDPATMWKQGAGNLRIERDLVRDVTRVSGAFTDQRGRLTSLTAEYDSAGKVITRFGSRMSGLGSILSQIGRDFQKVIEFAIATTVVFTALRGIINTVQTIQELDKSLRQFAITSNKSLPEARAFFSDLAQVAYDTATPLKELIKAADDIALATRRTGQSTEEWNRQILELTKSVGILTNLAGIDTVKATDLLTSSMKQLGLTADDTIIILNKATAVAGGQSNAIADIVQGLGVMAEAGKQAGLSIDQQIAAIQTLGQVTSKSPAEIATAFKNLVGSLDSRAGVKALTEFNIALRDSGGNLRNIIEIYSEISDKIQQGIIPADRVKELVKAIAGGPRRVPDAAALLSNINQIQAVTEKSINATNEALIANAKILDSTQAKLTQLSIAFDKFAFEKFAVALNEAANSIVPILKGILDALNMIPTAVITALIQFTAFYIGIKVGTVVVRTLKNTFLELVEALRLIPGAAAGAAAGIKGVAAAGATGAAGTATGLVDRYGNPIVSAPVQPDKLARFGGTKALKSVGIVGAAGALIGGATGGNPLSGFLTAAGIQGIIALPGPLKLLGVAAMGAGFAMEAFGNKSNAATENIQTNTEALLRAVQTHNDARQSIENLTTTQRTLEDSINNLQGKQSKTAEEFSQLEDFQNQYAANTLEIISVNKQLSASYDEITAALPKYGLALSASRAGIYSREDLRQLTSKIAADIFKAQNPQFVPPESFNFQPIGQYGQGNPLKFSPATGSTIAQGAGFGVGGRALPGTNRVPQFTLDLKELEKEPEKLKLLFTEGFSAITASIDPTIQNIQLLSSALEAMKGSLSPTEYENARRALQNFSAETNTFVELQIRAAQAASYLQSELMTGAESQDAVRRGQKINQIYKDILASIQQTSLDIRGLNFNQVIAKDIDFLEKQQNLVNLLNRFAFDKGRPRTTEIEKDEAIQIGTEYLRTTLPTAEFNQLVRTGSILPAIIALFKKYGLEVEGLGNTASNSAKDFKDLEDAIDSLAKGALTDFANKSADLRAQFLSGDISTQDYEKQKAQLKAIEVGISTVTKAWTKNLATLEDNKVIIGDVASKIIGLQNAGDLEANDLIAKFYELAQTMKLPADKIEELTAKLKEIAAIGDLLSKAKILPFDVSKDLASRLGAIASAIQDIFDSQRILYGTAQAAEAMGDAVAKAAEAYKILQDSIQAVADKALTDFAQKSADLRTQFLSGEISSKQYSQMLDDLVIVKDAVIAVTEAYKENSIVVDNNRGVIDKALSSIIGLQDTANLSTNDLIERVFSLAQQFGFTGKQIDILKLKLINLFNALAQIDKIRATFHIKADVDVRSMIGMFKALKMAQNIGGGLFGGLFKQFGNIDSIINTLVSSQSTVTDFSNWFKATGGSNLPKPKGSGGSKAKSGYDVGTLDIPDVIANAENRSALLQEAIRRARALQGKIPGATKEAKNDIVELLKGTQRILEVRGIKEELLRKALEELADIEKKRLEFETKADIIRRIRVGAGSFAAFADVPLNKATGVSVGSNQGPITVNLNINGQLLTPAQFDQLADKIGAAIKRQLGA